MTTVSHTDTGDTVADQPAAMSRADHRSIAALFRHPIARNPGWSDMVGLFGRLASVAQKSNHEFAFHVGTETLVLRKPRSKDLTASEVMELRHFATRAGCSPDAPAAAPAHLEPSRPPFS